MRRSEVFGQTARLIPVHDVPEVFPDWKVVGISLPLPLVALPNLKTGVGVEGAATMWFCALGGLPLGFRFGVNRT